MSPTSASRFSHSHSQPLDQQSLRLRNAAKDSTNSASLFFAVEKERETPSERLARLFREKERETQRLAKKDKAEDNHKISSSSSSSSSSASLSSSSSLFEKAAQQDSASSSALLSRLIGVHQKRSTFFDDS